MNGLISHAPLFLTLMLLMANLANTDVCKKKLKMTETLANGYSFESTQRGLFNEYQHDQVSMVFKDVCVLVLWTKLAPALEGLNYVSAIFRYRTSI